MKLGSALVSVMLVIGACGGSAPDAPDSAAFEGIDTSIPAVVPATTTTTSTSTSTSIPTSTTSLPPTTPTTLSDGLLAPEDAECTVLMASSWFDSEFGNIAAFNASDAASDELATALSTLGLTSQEVRSALTIPSEGSIALGLFDVLENTILWESSGDGADLGFILVCATYPGRTLTAFGENPAAFFTELYAGRYGLPGQVLLDPDATPFGDGTWAVGTDIRPGTYRADGGSNCYWAFLRGFPGTETGDIIVNNYGGGAQVVTILPSYAGFLSDNCGTWVPV